MYQVTRWLKSVALATHGLNEQEIDDAMKARELPVWAIEKIGETGVREFHSFTELGNNWRQMDGGQFGEAMTTAHFSNYFGDALSRAFYADYAYMGGSWREYTHPDSSPDFRDVSRFRMTEPGGLFLRREKAEAKATYISESEINYGVDEYARQFDVSWRVILNDDLGKIRETPTRMVKAVRRFEDEFVSNLYDNATTQAALNGLGAVYAGTGRLTAANLAIGLNAMMQRTDAAGNRIAISGVYLVIPPVLLITAQVLLQSVLLPGTANNDKNVLPQFIKGLKVDPFIGFAGANIPWYLVADPAEINAITVVRMTGFDRPWVAMKRSNIDLITGSAPAAYLMGSFETGDIEYMVTDIIGGWDDSSYVGVTDFRGIYYSSGTTA
jgi:hypothetical protein